MSEIEMKIGEYYETHYGDRWKCVAEIPLDIECKFVCCNSDGEIETFTKNGCFYADEDESANDLHRHLRGCTGFDWKEPEIPEGWRRLADDEVLIEGDRYLQANGMTPPVFSYHGRTVRDVQRSWSTMCTYPQACIREIVEPKFKVGDVVYATKPEDIHKGPQWVYEMDKLLGKPLTVRKLLPSGNIECHSSLSWIDWSFHPDWLSKEPPAAQYRPFANDEEYAPHFDRKVLRDSIASPGAKGQYRIGAFDESKVWATDGVQCTYEQMFKDGRKFADTNEPFGVKVN